MRASKVKINDVYTDDYGIKPKGRIEIPTPEQDIEHIEIKGRHGSLTKKYGFKDISLPAHFIMYGDNFKKIFRKAKMNLINAKTLSLDDDDEVFYRVKSVEINNAENLILKFGEFTVTFTLDPFQYETADSSLTITEEATLTNRGYESQPIITANVEGTGKIYVNDQTIGISGVNGEITLDSELLNAYRNDNGIITNLNNHMAGDFPILRTGQNEISFDGDITSLAINPRWRWV